MPFRQRRRQGLGTPQNEIFMKLREDRRNPKSMETTSAGVIPAGMKKKVSPRKFPTFPGSSPFPGNTCYIGKSNDLCRSH